MNLTYFLKNINYILYAMLNGRKAKSIYKLYAKIQEISVYKILVFVHKYAFLTMDILFVFA